MSKRCSFNHASLLSPEAGERRASARRLDPLLQLGVVLAALAIAAAGASPRIGGWNDASRLATVECLVDHHTLAIDQSTWFQDTGDKIRPRPDGPFYSDKPPTMALLMAVPYLVLHDGFGFRAAGHPEVFCYLMTLLSSGLAYMAAVWCIYRVGRVVGLAPGWSAALTASFGIATVALTYSRNVNSHLPCLAAAAAVLLNLAALDRPHGFIVGRLLLIGALAAFVYVLEQPIGGLLLVAAAVAAAVRLRRPTAVVWIALAALPWAAVHHLVTWAYAGTFGPANVNADFFRYEGSTFDESNLTGRWNHASIGAFAVYALGMLFGERGFLLSNPTLLLAFVAGWHGFAAQRGRRNSATPEPGRKSMAHTETVCFGLWCLAVWLLYAALSTNDSGQCCTIRWFLPLLAPAYFWLALLLRDRPQYRIDFVLLSGWGAVLAVYFWIGGPFTAYSASYNRFFPYFFWPVAACALLTWAARRALAATGAERRQEQRR
ncbi:MAG TPA: hypothetical protein VMS17_32070 [Gemmataceae bacterium]|nr:hypothetical protein [Gemmataceae bacterium]